MRAAVITTDPSEPIRVERDGDIARIVLNRPEKLNAMNKPMWLALGEAVGLRRVRRRGQQADRAQDEVGARPGDLVEGVTGVARPGEREPHQCGEAGERYYTVYAHLSEILKKRGEAVIERARRLQHRRQRLGHLGRGLRLWRHIYSAFGHY